MLINIDKPIDITPVAQNEIREQLEVMSLWRKDVEVGVRFGIKGGGCSGLSYNMEYVQDSDKQEKDTVIEFDNFKVYIDRKSVFYLKNVTIDYQGGLMGKGFVFNNPQATNSCGCGESFSL